MNLKTVHIAVEHFPVIIHLNVTFKTNMNVLTHYTYVNFAIGAIGQKIPLQLTNRFSTEARLGCSNDSLRRLRHMVDNLHYETKVGQACKEICLTS